MFKSSPNTTRAIIQLWPMAVSASFLMVGYEILRSATGSLFNRAYGAGYLPMATALTPVLIIGLLVIYGQLLAKFGPRRTLGLTILGSGLIFLLSYWGCQTQAWWVVGAVWIFREAYIMLLIEQYWSFFNSVVSSPEARRLNGWVLGVSSLGSIVGGLMAATLAKSLGTLSLLWVGALTFLPALLLSSMSYRRTGEPQREAHAEPVTMGLGLRLVRDMPLLRRILAVIILVQMVSAVVGFSFESVLQQEIPLMDEQTAYRANILSALNVVGLGLQFVVVPWLLTHIHLGWILISIPILHFLSSLLMVFYPSLSIASLAFISFKAIDYSLFRASKELLYIPFSFDVRFRAKEIVDVFGNRFGKSLVSWIFAGISAVGYMVMPVMGAMSVLICAAWIVTTLPFFRVAEAELASGDSAGK